MYFHKIIAIFQWCAAAYRRVLLPSQRYLNCFQLCHKDDDIEERQDWDVS